MDNARNILQKYGWKEGNGLGREGNGIPKPIKCGLKFDTAGLGYQEKVNEEENDQWWIRMFNQAAANIASDSEKKDRKTRKKEAKSAEIGQVGKILTDEELFEACGGRTAHKAARHGLSLNGKLLRIHEQDRMKETVAGREPIMPDEVVKLKSLRFNERVDERCTKKKKKSNNLKEPIVCTDVFDEKRPSPVLEKNWKNARRKRKSKD